MEFRKMALMNLFAGQQGRHRHREQTCGHWGNKRGRMNRQSNSETNTLPHAK